MITGRRALAGSILLLLVLSAFVLLNRGMYGWTVFVIVPTFLGAFSSWIFRPTTAWRAAGAGALTVFLAGCGLLVLGQEGLVCLAMALPLMLPLGALGGLLVFQFFRADDRQTAALVLLLPASLFYDIHAKPSVYSVRTSMVIQASPEVIWKHTVAFPDLDNTTDWLSHTGIALPKRTRLYGQGVGAARYCDLSTGSIAERVVVWNEPHVLRFEVTSTAPSLRETGLYGPVSTKHMTGYFISKQGQFVLSPLSNGRTLVEGTSWYQHGLWPGEYWRWWSDAIVHHIHRRVLDHIRALSEQESSRAKTG